MLIWMQLSKREHEGSQTDRTDRSRSDTVYSTDSDISEAPAEKRIDK